MAELLDCVELVSGDGPAHGCVVWLHGLGASGHDFPPVVPYLETPGLRFVFPHAPERPVTINAGFVMPAWYDITAIGPGGTNEQHVAETAASIEAILAREEEQFGADKVVLAGFSQGGAIALHVGLRHAQRLAGVLVLSAYEMFPDRREEEAHEANRETPIFFCHGANDEVVPCERGAAAYEGVTQAGWPTMWADYPMGHEVCLPEIQDIGTWLRDRLPSS